MNYYLILRALPFLLAAQSSMMAINDWMSVMLGPDCWNFSPEELNIEAAGERYGTVGASGQRYGVDGEALTDPLAQSLRYAVSGVGVHLLFIALMMIYMAIFGSMTAKDKRAPIAMLLLDGLTFGNAMGFFHPDTAGHPRCLESDIPLSECAKSLMTFAPVIALDLLWLIFVVLFPSKSNGNTKTKSQ